MKVAQALTTKQRRKTLWQTLAMGFISGMRSMFPAAILSHYLSKNSSRSLRRSKLGFMASPIAAGATKLLVGNEVVFDKLPSTQDRIKFPVILFRIISGSFAGALIAVNNKESVTKGILLGCSGALVGSYAFYYLRKYIDTLPNVKDKYVGAAEDVLAAGLGIAIMH